MKLTWPRLHRRRRTFISIVAVTFFLLTISVYINYTQAQHDVQLQYRKAFEQIALAQLDSLHSNNLNLVSQFYADSVISIEAVAKDPVLAQKILTPGTELDQYAATARSMTHTFGSLSLLNPKGIVLSTSNDDPTAASVVGKDLSGRAYIQELLTTKKTVTTPAFKTIRGIYAVVFATPILDANNTVIGIILAGNNLQSLHTKLSAISDPSPFIEVHSVVVDDSGNLVLSEAEPKLSDAPINLKGKERMITDLLTKPGTYTYQEHTDLYGESFVKGTSLPVAHVEVISYYPKAQFESKIDDLKDQLAYSHLWVALRDIFGLLIAYVFIALILERHEKLD